jgi:hypothetical protein
MPPLRRFAPGWASGAAGEGGCAGAAVVLHPHRVGWSVVPLPCPVRTRPLRAALHAVWVKHHGAGRKAPAATIHTSKSGDTRAVGRVAPREQRASSQEGAHQTWPVGLACVTQYRRPARSSRPSLRSWYWTVSESGPGLRQGHPGSAGPEDSGTAGVSVEVAADRGGQARVGEFQEEVGAARLRGAGPGRANLGVMWCSA